MLIWAYLSNDAAWKIKETVIVLRQLCSHFYAVIKPKFRVAGSIAAELVV